VTSRYFTNVIIALLAGLVIVASQVFAPATVAWLAFGIAIVALGTSVLAQLDSQRGVDQRALDGAMAVISSALVVVSLVFAGATVTWLAFGLALGFVGVALAGLTLHEVETWRSAHHLDQLHGLAFASRPTQAEPAQPPLSQAA
jgi:O-antigen/teichoic acid export membrane protein